MPREIDDQARADRPSGQSRASAPRRHRPVFLFDGFGRGMSGAGQRLRGVLGFDLTIVVAFVNVAVFVWLMQCRRWLFDQTRMAPLSGGAN